MLCPPRADQRRDPARGEDRSTFGRRSAPAPAGPVAAGHAVDEVDLLRDATAASPPATPHVDGPELRRNPAPGQGRGRSVWVTPTGRPGRSWQILAARIGSPREVVVPVHERAVAAAAPGRRRGGRHRPAYAPAAAFLTATGRRRRATGRACDHPRTNGSRYAGAGPPGKRRVISPPA